jgi:hypothetical protein
MRTAYKILFGKMKGRDNSEDPGADGRMISKWILGKQSGKCVDMIHVAQDRDRWWAIVNTVMNLRVL